MRRRLNFQDRRPEFEVTATNSGGAQLVKHLNGKMELRGGSVEDPRAIREWLEKFMPNILASLPRPLDRRNK